MKPTLPQGTRDFNAEVIRRRRFILDTIREVFELYGFEPLETPAMENLETLMGKYGDEGDKLMFKILNNGLDNPAKREDVIKAFEKIFEGKNSTVITERALRYDLTIPFARYVAMNFGKLTLPFKRYQMQPVWRADRPQKGRYREFYQCDADVVGSYSLLNEVELANIYATVFEKLGIDVEIKINSRKILYALAIAIERFDLIKEDHFIAVDDNRKKGLKIISTIITTAIDKMDKVGIDGVKNELIKNGISNEQFSLIFNYINIKGGSEEKLSDLKNLFSKYKTVWATDENFFDLGIKEIESFLEFIKPLPFYTKVIIDFTLARGLNYYTGIIYEVKAKNVSIGSIGGGGRYDDLTGLFGLPNIPGVGISFGVDRIYDVMNELNIFPETINSDTKVLFFNLGEKESMAAFTAMQQLRNNGISCELFYENVKMDKQFKYANKKNIAFAVIIGSRELEQQTCIVKDLKKEEQQTIDIKDLLSYFTN